MAAPTMTFNAAGNVLAAQALAASASVTTATIDVSTRFEAQFQVSSAGGATVNAVNGCRVQAYRVVGGGTTVDTVPSATFDIATLVSATAVQTLPLPTGRWQIKLTNLDTSNGINVQISDGTVDTIT
ncbi:MAG: hypothetical protein LC772_06690 [Chloroflexi bacterium]|nr:hypothetical protein [Chloroflexota bacterium]